MKVQYPAIADAVESDMRNLRILSPVLRQLLPGLDVAMCSTSSPSGSSRSATTSWSPPATGGSAASGADHPFVLVPAVDTELSRRRVLVSEWVDGQGFNEVAAEPEPVRDRYAEIVYRFFYGTVLNWSWRSATRIRATTCSAPTAASPSLTSGWSGACRPTTCARRRR